MSEENRKKGIWKMLPRQEGNYTPQPSPRKNNDVLLKKSGQDEHENEGEEDFLREMRKLGVQQIKNASEQYQFQNTEQKFFNHDMKGVLSEEDLLYKNESSKGPYIVELGDKSSIMRKMNMRMIQLKSEVHQMKVFAQKIVKEVQKEKKLLSEELVSYKMIITELIQKNFQRQRQAEKSQKQNQNRVEGDNYLQALELKKELIFLGQQYEKAELKIREQEDQMQLKQIENQNLQQLIFDYEQHKAQLDLEVENRIQRALAENKKDGDKEYYLKQITFLQEEIQKLSEKCLRTSSQRQFMLEREQNFKERESQLLVKQTQIDQQFAQLQSRQSQVMKNVQKLKIKQSQLIKLQQNLYKKMEDLDLRENEIVSARKNNNRIVSSQAYQRQQKTMLDENRGQADLQLHGRCFNNDKQFKGSYTFSRPISNVNKRNEPFLSKATRDLDTFSNGSQSKDKVIKNKLIMSNTPKMQRSSASGGGSKLSNLGSKLQQLRNEIKKQIQAVK